MEPVQQGRGGVVSGKCRINDILGVSPMAYVMVDLPDTSPATGPPARCSPLIIAGVLILSLSGCGRKADPDAAAFFTAASTGDPATLSAILDRRSDLIGARDEKKRTPLHWAAQNGHLEAVTLLVEQGADVNAQVDWIICSIRSRYQNHDNYYGDRAERSPSAA